MKLKVPDHAAPMNADALKAIEPVVCYPPDSIAPPDFEKLGKIRSRAKKTDEILVRPRDAGCIEAPAGSFFRISSVDGPQVGDLNLWNRHDLNERFYSGKTRALHGTHVSKGDRAWSSIPHFRPMATITDDTLDWYGFDSFGGPVHDVIGTRCDPYTGRRFSGDCV